MQFLKEIAADASERFKDTADAVWDSMRPTTKNSGKLKEASRIAGKYALTANLAMMMNFPDNAELFRDTFNVTGPHHTGAKRFFEDEETSDVGLILGRGANIAMVNNKQAQMAQGYADVLATSTLSDIQKMLPMLVAVSQMKGDK